jgi:DNA-directed RNA polymerase specialized sigma24 family protein
VKAVLGEAASPASDLNRALSLCAGGDRSALRVVYDSEAPRMLGVAMRLLRRRALAEEAVHDTFLQICRSGARRTASIR